MSLSDLEIKIERLKEGRKRLQALYDDALSLPKFPITEDQIDIIIKWQESKVVKTPYGHYEKIKFAEPSRNPKPDPLA